MNRLALSLGGQGKWTEAESVHREALALWRKRAGNENLQTLSAIRNLATTLEGEGKWSEAETAHREILAMWRKQTDDVNEDIYYTLDRLAAALEAQRKWSDAESVLREALAARRGRGGDTDVNTLNLMHRLALMLGRAGKWSDAEIVSREALALWRKKSGDNDPQTLYAMRNVAETYEGEGKLSEAEASYREELGAWRKLAGDEDQQTFYTRRKLGLILESEGKWPEAETVFRESLALARKRAGDTNPEALADLERLVRVLLPQKKFAKAKQLLDEVLTPTFVDQPSSVNLLVQRVNLMGRQERWRDAAADAVSLQRLQPTDHYHYHRLAALLAISQERPAYELLCRKIIATFTNTANPYVAERIAQDCLLLPDSGADLRLVDKLADLAVTLGNGEPSLPYFQGCKAMSDYRLGHFHEAIEWAQKSTKSPAAESQAKAKAYAVMAMASWQLGEKDVAKAMLAKGEALAPNLGSAPDTRDIGESWVAWLMARISLDEAAAFTRSGPTSDGNSDYSQ